MRKLSLREHTYSLPISHMGGELAIEFKGKEGPGCIEDRAGKLNFTQPLLTPLEV